LVIKLTKRFEMKSCLKAVCWKRRCVNIKERKTCESALFHTKSTLQTGGALIG
jgi:hypothetical protein